MEFSSLVKMSIPVVWRSHQISWNTLILLICFNIITCTHTTLALDLSQCNAALGMQSGEILNSSLSASSSRDPVSFGPACSRIRLEINEGAWCPSRVISKDVYEYLEIDLLELKVITVVETQGRFGRGQGQEYTEQYRLEYRREKSGSWFHFKTRRGHEIFQGNTNTYIAEMRDVIPAITTRWIRFVPYSVHSKTICLRVELYGCSSPSGVVSYSMQQGDYRKNEIDFKDFTYDGTILEDRLIGGLGQLMDGEEGLSNFRLDPHNHGHKGYSWVGWRNDSLRGLPLDITFKFDHLRNFTSMRVHSNNMYTKDVRVFREVKIYVVNGKESNQNRPAVEYPYKRDEQMEYARFITIPLEHIVAKEIRVDFYFDDRWLLISEIEFTSEIVEESVVSDLPAGSDLLSNDDFATDPPPHEEFGSLVPIQEPPYGPISPPTNVTNSQEFVGVQDKSIIAGSNKTQAEEVSRKYKTPKPTEAETDYIAIAIGALAVIVLILISIIIIIFIRRRKDRCFSQKFLKNTSKPSISTVDPHSPYPTLHFQRTIDLPLYGQGALDDGCSSPTDPLISSPVPLITPYATSDLLQINGLPPWGAPREDESLALKEFPRNSLKYVMSLGEGQFGHVCLCEVIRSSTSCASITDMLKSDSAELNDNRTKTLSSSKSVLVAVKMMRKDADEPTKLSFHREAEVMARLLDPNIVRLIGVCLLDEPYCIVMEYMKCGDLKQFLQRHVPDGPVETSRRGSGEGPETLSYSCLIYLATQIASGMKYLESLNVLHRDLATRNCLVGNNYRVKISDFGTSRNLYRNDYYTAPGKLVLPIRWMSWEAILLGRFSSKSDVWSFAVTLWEILTFAKRHPYDSCSDEQLVLRCDQVYRTSSPWPCLDQPDNCPREIYDLMCHCWSREAECRPSFHEIHMFLRRKNIGYRPTSYGDDEDINEISSNGCNTINGGRLGNHRNGTLRGSSRENSSYEPKLHGTMGNGIKSYTTSKSLLV